MTEIAVIDGAEIATSTLFGTDNPVEVLSRSAKVAEVLERLVRQQKLVVKIGQSEHILVEGWTLLGSMLGVFPIVVWTRPVMADDAKVGWEARVEARTRGGEIVGAAEAECLRDERTWKSRDDYALRSMAQTRAVSKALRLPLGFVMQIAGFSPTPAEEMPVIEVRGVEVQPVEDDGLFPPLDVTPPAPEPLTAAQKKRLNMLVGQLRDGGHITTLNLYNALGRAAVPSADGELHWTPLRESMTKAEGIELIDRLSRLEENVGKPPFEVPEAARPVT